MDKSVRILTDALEELKSTALEVRQREREATQAAEDVKLQLKQVANGHDAVDEEVAEEKRQRQQLVVQTLQTRKGLRVMLKQVIAEMERAKVQLDRGLLIRSQGETAADAQQALQDMAEASASAKLMRQRCSTALAGREQGGSSAPSAQNESPGGHACGQGRGGEARRALLEEARKLVSDARPRD